MSTERLSDAAPVAPVAPAAPAAPAKEPAKATPAANPMRRPALVVVAIAAVFFVYGLIADRVTPYTAQATIQAYVVKIAPEIAGRVAELGVGDNARVKAGEVLLRLDPEPYRIAVERAAAQLEVAGQSVGSSTAGVVAAEASVANAVAARQNTREQANRVLELVKKGIYPQARYDTETAALTSADAAVAKAEAELEQARQSMGSKGLENAQIRDASAALRRAQLDLTRTTIQAPSDGVVTNLQLGLGQFVPVGQAAMTYIDVREIWVDAAFRENTLENMKPGDPVEIVLDVRPGRVYRGKIESIGYGVSSKESDPVTGLPEIRNASGWIRDPQPIPVRVAYDREQPIPNGVRLGSQANIIVYTADNPVMNALAWLRIRLVAFLSYVN